MKLEHLFEATFMVDDLVDILYNKYFKKFIHEISYYVNGDELPNSMPELNSYTISSVDLEKLTNNKQIIKANVINPVSITLGSFDVGSHYAPNRHEISISFNKGVYDLLKEHIQLKLPFSSLKEMLPRSKHFNFMQEVTGEAVKATIAHELSHWLSDTFHNKHLHKMISKAEEAPFLKKIITKGKSDVGFTYYEIDAQIHALKQLKRKVPENFWNIMEFDDIFDFYPSFNTIKNRNMMKNKTEYMAWRKDLIKRMAREGLLGRNMR